MKLTGYVRVSTAGQADGLGLDVQERQIRSYAKGNRHRLVALHRDEGSSGTLDVVRRPHLAAALVDVSERRAGGLIVARLDRLARALTVQEAILARVWADGGIVIAVDAGEIPRDDPADPMRTAMRQMVGVFSQLDRAMVIARMRGGRELKAQQGGYAGGKPPYGYRAAGGELVEDDTEQDVLRDMRRLRQRGWSYRAIADDLNVAGVATRTGGAWHPTVVRRILIRWLTRRADAACVTPRT